MRVAVALTLPRKETRPPTIAGMRRSNLARTPRLPLAVLIPRPTALTRLLAAAMVVVAALILAVAQLPTAAVAALPMAAVAVLTVIVNLNVFEKGPPLPMGRAFFFVCPLPLFRWKNPPTTLFSFAC